MTKYCINCKDCRELNNYWCKSDCLPRDLVTGGPISVLCSEVRDNKHMCGMQGSWFVEKPAKITAAPNHLKTDG